MATTLQSYNNRVIKLGAEEGDGLAFEQDMVRAKIEEDALIFAMPLRATKPGKHAINGLFRVGYIHDSDEMAIVSLRLIASVTGNRIATMELELIDAGSISPEQNA